MAAASSDKFVSSFQRKGRRKVIQITGTRPSLHNGQLLLSSGIPSLDHILGGGVAVGTVLLIEEDVYSRFARLLLKYFVAEGFMCGHYSFLSSLDYNLNKLLTELPCPVENKPSIAQNQSLSSISDSNTAGRVRNLEDTRSLPPQQRSNEVTTANNKRIEAAGERNMEIAWRYQNMPPVKTEMATSCNIFGHTYDLTKTMSAEKINQDKLWCYHPPKILDKSFQNSRFDDLFEEIKQVIDKSGCNLQAAPKATNQNVMRLALLSLGSPLWSGTTAEENASLCHFLHRMRATIRKSLAVCIVTIPTHLFQTMYIRRIERLCDYVVRLESFAGEEKSPAFKEYHGLFHVVQIPRLNCLANYAVDNDDLAFKLKRKKFSIEKIHLPPDLSETVSRSQGEHLKTIKGCAESNKNPTSLDF